MCETSSEMVPELVGPSVRWVSVLRASRMLDATLPVASRRCPGRSVSDQNRLSGLWFHCHCGPRFDPFHAFSADSVRKSALVVFQ